MNCPLCNKHLIEVDVDVEADFLCPERINFGGQYGTYPHFEWRAEEQNYIVRAPPYILYVGDNETQVCMAEISGSSHKGKYSSEVIFTINSLNKSNIDKFTKNYKDISSKIKRLIIFS